MKPWQDFGFGPELNPDGYIIPLQNLLAEIEPTRGLEIGFCWGMSAYAFLSTVPGTLLSIDLDDNKGKEALFRTRYRTRFDLKYGVSWDVVAALPDDDLYDWIYVDGAHDEQSVLKDLDAVVSHLAPGGVIALDDYQTHEGVKRAVDAFFGETWERHEIAGHGNGGLWFTKR